MKYCAVNLEWDEFVGGETKKQIVDRVFTWHVDSDRVLYSKAKYYKSSKHHSFSAEFTEEEVITESIDFLFGKLEDYGWGTFINTKSI